jgi:hypothetical protein
MTSTIQTVTWYRSRSTSSLLTPSVRRTVRNWLMACLPEPRVRGKTIVMNSRRTFPKLSWSGLYSEFHGFFSEFHSVLGALAYATAHEAAGVRVDFRSPLYVDSDRGPNWWTYFFEDAVIPLEPERPLEDDEIPLDRIFTRYGRFGGFSDIVQGSTPYLYPMTYGLDRTALHQLVTRYVRVRDDIREEVERFLSTRFGPNANVVGVHYRGTDATHNWTGALTHYRTLPLPYSVYADEIRAAVDATALPDFQVFVATDEIEFLEFMREEFGDRVVCVQEAPRVRAKSQAIHLDRTLPMSNYQKGKSALIDCLVLAATSYLVKGRSNLSDASLVFNPQLPYSFCPDVSVRLHAKP